MNKLLPSELRIKSVVGFVNSDKTLSPFIAHAATIKFLEESDIAATIIRAVPLSIEHIGNMGFIQEGDPFDGWIGFVRKENPMNHLLQVWDRSDGKIDVYVSNYGGMAFHLKSLDYIHQLQNAWYWITGEEITLNGAVTFNVEKMSIFNN